MKRVFLAAVFTTSLLVGCSSTTPTSQSNQAQIIYSSTMAIIEAAAKKAPRGVTGTFTLKINGSGSQGEVVYLNTEKDYRDPRAVSVALHPRIIARLKSKYEMSPQDFFLNKSIEVKGQAKKVKIRLFADGKPTDKYYYQTHIRVTDAANIKVVG
jgi:hypothetical protein